MVRSKAVVLVSCVAVIVTALAADLVSQAKAATSFGIKQFTMSAVNEAGEPYTQAGGHPFALNTNIEFNTTEDSGTHRLRPVQEVKDIQTEVPVGLVGNPTATSRCSHVLFLQVRCPATTQVGYYVLRRNSGVVETGGVYNLVAEPGSPGELGIITPEGVAFPLPVHVNSGGHDALVIEDQNVLMVGLEAIEISLWGVPAEAAHDPLRGRTCRQLSLSAAPQCQQPGKVGLPAEGGETDSEPPRPFLTLPADCAGGLPSAIGPTSATLRVDSWESPDPGFPAAATEKTQEPAIPPVTGCQALAFEPALEAAPGSAESAQAGQPDGLHVALDVPQTSSPGENAAPEVKDAVVTLPSGMTLNPSAADGLQACSDSQFAQSSSEPAGCPEQSIVGSATVETPLLSKPLQGQLFVGEPLCGNAAHPIECTSADAANGSLFRLFMQVRGEGVTVKLPGTASVDPATGQVTTRFEKDPQLPFEHLQIDLTGGPRAALANPEECAGLPVGPGGQPLELTTSDFTPWSSPYTPEATPSSGFEVSGCADARPFKPGFSAGTVHAQAGQFTPFTLTFSRKDGEQDLSGLQVTTPPGLAAMLAKVPLCGEPQAEKGTCSVASQIGVVHAAAGAGSHPLWLEGRVYLTIGYKGAPFGLSVVVPAVAGPFNLGDVVVRSAIDVDPKTAAVTITSNPLPQSRDGVPFRLQTVNVTIDRPEFMFNPTDCDAKQVTGTIASAEGATAQVSIPFAVGGCRGLPFKPSFTARTRAAHSRRYGAYLHVTVKSGFGQANIARVHVTLPKALPSRDSTLKDACTEAQFAKNPGGCPAGSVVGIATAHTPVLPVALKGPAIFVSHGGLAFPDLDVVLQGDGVTVVLSGHTHIHNGLTTSTFASVPDVPVKRFDLVLPQSRHSALAAFGNLCGKALHMPTTITGQNGAVIHQKTKIVVTRCGHKAKAARHRHWRRDKGSRANRRVRHAHGRERR